MATTYTSSDIQVLEGLEPVRKRPGMFIGGVGSAGLHHLVWEIVDNSVDEAMNGHADEISVTLHKDGQSVTVVDNGRGVILMRPGKEHDDRIVGALALARDGTFLAVTPEGTERRLAVADVPAGRRAGKGQKVVKRGGVAALRRVEG